MEVSNGVVNLSYVSHGDDVIGRIDKNEKRRDDPLKTNSEKNSTKTEERQDPSRTLSPEEKREKKLILKNILIISTAFFFLFTSYNSMSNLQSSLNKVNGTASLTGLYVAYIFSCCFLPSWVLKKLKEKKTMIVCMLLFSAYISAQFYPRLYTLLPGAIIVGLAAAPMWSAKCTYLTKVSTRYGELEGERSDVIVTRFFGIFFLFFQATQVVGNLISSLVLSVGIDYSTPTLDAESFSKCGYHFCISEVSQTTTSNSTGKLISDGPPLWQIYTMASIYLVCSLLSALVILTFLDPLDKFPKVQVVDASDDKSTKELLAATFNHMKHPYQLLIIPLTMWSGMEQSFLSADFTAAYVSCTIGVHMVGYIIVCYGVCDSIFSYIFSPLVKHIGRVPLFTLAFGINLTIIIVLTKWQPHPDDKIWFFVVSGFWGIADAVWQAQINSLYGVIFPGQSAAAFSNYRLWESTGFCIAYACSTILCIDGKITILLILLIPGITLYYIIEVIERRGGLKRDVDGQVLTIDKLMCRRG